MKDPEKRPLAKDLLGHPFIAHAFGLMFTRTSALRARSARGVLTQRAADGHFSPLLPLVKRWAHVRHKGVRALRGGAHS